MLLTTRCPHCAATFEVVPDQLQRRGGLVRCGECATVFDGKACLVDAPFVPTAPAVLRGRMDRVASGLSRKTHNDHRRDDERQDDALAVPAIIADPHPYVRPRAVPEFMNEHVGVQRRWAQRLWGMAAWVALLALIVQTLVAFRVVAATQAPALRPALEALCRPLGCVVGYERRAERFAVTASSLQSTHTGDTAEDAPARLVLGVTLRNRYLYPQPWPALMLDLRDFADTVVVRRALMPDEYLPKAMAAQPLDAGAEIALSIPLTVTGVRISGYQVNVFHP